MGGNITLANRPIRITDIKDPRALNIANDVNSQQDWRKDSISKAGIGDEFLTGAELTEFKAQLIKELMGDYIIEQKKSATIKADSIIEDARYSGGNGFLKACGDTWHSFCKWIGW